jgi:hypothetical protein
VECGEACEQQMRLCIQLCGRELRHGGWVVSRLKELSSNDANVVSIQERACELWKLGRERLHGVEHSCEVNSRQARDRR